MAKHTPGPWQFSNRNWRGEEDTRGNLYVTGNYQEGDQDDSDNGPSCVSVAKVMGNPTAGEIPSANARLIAAAPELLESAEGLVQAVSTFCSAHGISGYLAARLSDMRDAIAKATDG